jgi:DNA (cytosine-5)-methyltransferase 1
MMNYLDLFSGVGGFHLGLKQAGLKFENVYFSEIDKYASSVYKNRFPKSKELGDVRTIKSNRLPKGRWIVSFGFPCQDLSIAGKRAGFDGERSSLFFAATRIIRALRPEIFIFENVKGLFSANNGKAFVEVLREIADIRLYDCEWQLVNTSWFLPQNRERIYFVGHLRGSSFGKVFPLGENSKHTSKKQTKSIQANCLTASCYKGAGSDGMALLKIGTLRTHKDGNGFRKMKDDICPAIPARAREDGSGQPVIAIDLKTASGTSKTRRGGVSDICPTLDHNCSVGINAKKIRRLTPTECERLQGFPDGWTECGENQEKISDTQRYKMMGNAVSVPVVEAIGRKL